MTAVESLRYSVEVMLTFFTDVGNAKRLHDTCLIYADALEEDELGKFANFWRLVATRQVWPDCRRDGKPARRFGWHTTFAEWPFRRKPDHLPVNVFLSLGKPSFRSTMAAVKYYHSLSKAILSLEKAWGAVDCEAASV